MVESGTAPDICGQETSYRQGYLTIVVHGKRAISGLIIPHDHEKVAEFLIEQGAPLDRTPESHLRGVRQSRIKIWNFGLPIYPDKNCKILDKVCTKIRIKFC